MSESRAKELHELPQAVPPVDIYENGDGYLLRADLPGITRDQVDLHFERGELRIEARRELEAVEGDVEQEYGSVVYRRAFKFPEAVDSSQISAELSNGVLELRLPKSPESRPRKIEVRVA